MKVVNTNNYVKQIDGNLLIGGSPCDIKLNKTGIKRIFWRIFGGIVDFTDPTNSKKVLFSLKKCDVISRLDPKSHLKNLQKIINAFSSKNSSDQSISEEFARIPTISVNVTPVDEKPKIGVVYIDASQRLRLLSSYEGAQKPIYPNYNFDKALRNKIESEKNFFIELANSDLQTTEADQARLGLIDFYIRDNNATFEKLSQAKGWVSKLKEPNNLYVQNRVQVLQRVVG